MRIVKFLEVCRRAAPGSYAAGVSVTATRRSRRLRGENSFERSRRIHSRLDLRGRALPDQNAATTAIRQNLLRAICSSQAQPAETAAPTKLQVPIIARSARSSLLLPARQLPKQQRTSQSRLGDKPEARTQRRGVPVRPDWRLEDALRHQGGSRTKGLRVPAEGGVHDCVARLQGTGQPVESPFHEDEEPLARGVVSSGLKRGLRPGAFWLELHADVGEVLREPLDALVVPRLAMVGERLAAHFGLPGPPGRGEREDSF